MLKIVFILSIFIFISRFNLYADTLKVGDSHLKSIKTAISFANPHDYIVVLPGKYLEGNILISKPIHLIGLDYPVIDGDFKYEVLTITSDSVEIRGFIIQNIGKSFTQDFAGIKVIESSYCQIQNNKLVNTFFGIYLKKARFCKILNNELITDSKDEVNSGNGIHLWDCKYIIIKDNHITGHRDGIYFEFVDHSKVIGNTSEHNLRYGLHFMFSNFDIYEKNIFRENGTGVAVMFSKNISMNNNYFLENWGSASYGLLFKEIYDGDLTGNIFLENTIGLYADGSNRIHIAYNEFVRNGWAINMLGNSIDNTITQNNFIGNTFDIATNTRHSKNRFVGNFWDQYTGYDLNADGVGDIPFRPMKVFSYVTGRVPESIILLRSQFIDMLNFAEKVAPVITPADLKDDTPSMKRHLYD